MAYPITIWQDEVDEYEDRYNESMNSDGTISHTKVRGNVLQVGTPQNAENFNNMERGISDANLAGNLAMNAIRQNQWRTEKLETAMAQEVGQKTLTNSQIFLFNDSQESVALVNRRDNLNYVVEVISVTAVGGPAGEIEISDRQVNGFKIAFTGSASSVTVTYAVIGGYD